MEIEELLKYRKDLLEDSKDDEGFVQQPQILSQALPSMFDAKLVDSEDYNDSYYLYSADDLKINGYVVNESGERLQLFLVDEKTINETATNDELLISQKKDYEKQLKRAIKFVRKAIKGQLNDYTQDSSPAKALISQISSSEGVHQFDVIQIFLISLSATVSFKGKIPQPRSLHFKNEEIHVTYTKNDERKKKSILILSKLIDLNFLYNDLVSRGRREALTVNFKKTFGYYIEVLKAAEEKNFESYLCVLPAYVIADLYKHYSSRLLEKNVRSFLQFRGVNRGIRQTINKEPDKFIAYNNGLTITSTKAKVFYKKKRIYIESLTDFQIVNGGQTTATIYFSEKDGLDISKINVMAKITVAKKTTDEELDDLISNISQFSNAQSRVSKVDLRSRNPQLIKLKTLSDSVMTPGGYKWFFERAKGQFSTKLRFAGSNKKSRLKREYPPARRFSKELLAKYYSAWGDKPYMVKKGGEKIFRSFIEELCPEEEGKVLVEIDRSFYEKVIAKIILFRKMEKIYGQGKNSIGQLRSAVIPYSISVIYHYTDGTKRNSCFDLLKIWKNEGLEDDISEYLKDLMILMNDLIKKYSLSDDYGEYSKRKELWSSIIHSMEIKNFLGTSNSQKILNKYTIFKEESELN